MVSKKRHASITPETVSQFFNVGITKAMEILDKSTQAGVRRAVNPIQRRYRSLPELHRTKLDGRWSMDHIHSDVLSLRQNKGAFIISNGEFTKPYPRPTKDGTDAAKSLQAFCDEVGVPVNLKTDLAGC